jgi:hypothetical protein
MLEVIGFLVWILFTLWLTALPVVLILGSSLVGGMGFTEKAVSLNAACLAGISWYYIFTSLTITLN